jgi:hypothetical protein
VTTAERTQNTEEAEALARLRRLLEEGAVEEARRLAPEMTARWPASAAIQHLARVLEPPRVVPSPPGLRGRSFDREHAWLQQHAGEHPGCWLAIYGDQLIAANPDLSVVRRAIRAAIGDEMALLHYEPAEQR